MRRPSRIKCAVALVALMALCLVPPYSHAQSVVRKSAEFRNFDLAADPPETVDLFGTVPGALLYTKTLLSKIGESELYLTVSAAGDTHGGARLLIGCFVDGPPYDATTACNPGTAGASAKPPGWVVLQKMPAAISGSSNCNEGGGGAADCHDNGVAYTWCKVVKDKATHTVDLRLGVDAPGFPPGIAFVENAHFYIDTVKGALEFGHCTQGLP